MPGKPRKPLIVILGPTAVGKTGLAIQIAQALNGEIVGADSRQIYRYMDIGTAKPSAGQQAEVQHHLIDVVNPDDNLTLAEYQAMTYTAIDQLHAAGKLPLLVGGTGQYLSAVTEGWSIPEVRPNDDLREELELFAEQQGVSALHQRLVEVDPDAAVNIHPNNVRRVVRALEVYYETGEPISILQQKNQPDYTIMELGLTLERQELYERADLRLEFMLQAGFMEEVEHLLNQGYSAKLPSMSALGYRQLAEYINGDVSREEAIENTRNATHSFIRRQYTWFRGHDNGIVWHNMGDLDTDQLIAGLSHWLEVN